MNTKEIKSVLEAALICARDPLGFDVLCQLFDGEFDRGAIRILLDELRSEWNDRGIELVELSSGWCLQSQLWVRPYLERLDQDKPPKYSRAALETLAIIAYRQPVTRANIEEIRGVVTNPQLIKQFEDRGWIEIIGHREAPGRPALYATTRKFLDDFGLCALDKLPLIHEALSSNASFDKAVEAVEDPQLSILPNDDNLLPLEAS